MVVVVIAVPGLLRRSSTKRPWFLVCFTQLFDSSFSKPGQNWLEIVRESRTGTEDSRTTKKRHISVSLWFFRSVWLLMKEFSQPHIITHIAAAAWWGTEHETTGALARALRARSAPARMESQRSASTTSSRGPQSTSTRQGSRRGWRSRGLACWLQACACGRGRTA